MAAGILGIVWLIIFSVGALIMTVYLRKYSNVERMSMIEKGMSPSDIKRTYNTSIPLRFSLLLIGVGFGLLIGYFLDRAFYMNEVAYFAMIFICGGAGLGAAYLIEEKKAKKEV